MEGPAEALARRWDSPCKEKGLAMVAGAEGHQGVPQTAAGRSRESMTIMGSPQRRLWTDGTHARLVPR